MSIELNEAQSEVSRNVLLKFSSLFPMPEFVTDENIFAAIWYVAVENLDEDLFIKATENLLLTMTRFPYPAELIAEVKVLQATADVKPNIDEFSDTDTEVKLIRDERLKAYELYCEAKLANALQAHPKVKAAMDTTDPIEASEKSDRIITCLIQELLNIRHPKAYVDVKPNKVGFSDTYIELMREERLSARDLYLNHKNAEAYLERNGWERVKPAKAPQRNDSFPSMEGYEAWIEGGRTLDSAYEFIIAIASPHATAQIIQDGFWLEITGPGKVFIGWMRFVHLSNIKQKALFVVSEFRFPCECAPDEKQVLCPSLIPEKWGNGYKKSVL